MLKNPPSKLPKMATSRFVSGPNDSLAAGDIYEISNNLVRSRATVEPNREINSLVEAIRLPYDQVDLINPTSTNMLEDIKKVVGKRTSDYLESLSPGMGDVVDILATSTLSNKTGPIDPFDLIPLDLSIFINNKDIKIPSSQSASAIALNAVLNEFGVNLGSERLAKNTISDIMAETLAYTAIGSQMIENGMGPLVKDILDIASNEIVRKGVALGLIPKAVNPRNRRLPDPRQIRNSTEGPIHRPRVITGPNIRETRNIRNKPLLVSNDNVLVDDINRVGNGVTVGHTERERIEWGVDEDYSDIFETDSSHMSSREINLDRKNSSPGLRDGTVHGSDLDNDPVGTGLDLDTLLILKDYVSSGEIMASYPNLHRVMLQTYRFPVTRNLNLRSEYEKLIGLMDLIKPNWDKGTRGNDVTSLAPLSRASKDAIHLLTTYVGSRFVVEALIAKSYNRNKIPNLLRTQYPNIGF